MIPTISSKSLSTNDFGVLNSIRSCDRHYSYPAKLSPSQPMRLGTNASHDSGGDDKISDISS